MDEFERIAWLKVRFERDRTAEAAALGIGDDAAVLARSDAYQVVSVDAAVEGVHFRWSFASAEVLAARAVSAAVSDLAAMGARPRALLCAMTLAADVDDRRFKGLVEGYAAAAAGYGLTVIGGNLTSGATTSLTTTAIGEADVWTGRGSAVVGDRVFVSGPLGGSALGLQALLKGRQDGPLSPHIERWRSPRARLDLCQSMGPHVHAAIDISDGLLQDLGHLCTASQVGAEVEADAIPLAPNLVPAARSLGLDPLDLALCGGEDYELILCAPEDSPIEAWATPIGRIVGAHPGTVSLCRGGQDVTAPSGAGFRHFDGNGRG